MELPGALRDGVGGPGCVGSRAGSRARGARRGSHEGTGLADPGTGRLAGDSAALDPSGRDPGDLDAGHRRHPPAVCARRGCPRAGPSSERPATRACGLPGLAPNLPAPPWVPRFGVGVGGGTAPGRRGNPGRTSRGPAAWGISIGGPRGGAMWGGHLG